MRSSEIEQWMEDRGGVATTQEVAEYLEIDRRYATSKAEEIGVRRVGSSYAWLLPDVLALDEVSNEDDEDEDDEDEDDEEREE
ncbi:MAG: hypothetical protein HY898_34530 [Deltaproteobacteria bacterium]|nr:hypothetical protein [Deltaproteobacteria bacterium]